MVRFNFDYLLQLPGSPQEQAWIREHLETLSVRECHALEALNQFQPCEDMTDAINHLCALNSCDICFPARNYEELGQFYLRHESHIPEDALPYVNLRKLGELYGEDHPGMFIGGCFVCRPRRQAYRTYFGWNEFPLEDGSWSVKLKLASPAVPEGVWLCLPDVSGLAFEEAVEPAMVLDALQVQELDDCTLLEARCFFPELNGLERQYDSIKQLVMDGDTLGYLMGEMKREDMEPFAAALEYEGCRSLCFALDIIQNPQCYDYIPYKSLKSFAEKHLREEHVSEELIQSCCIDLESYARDLLETSGYMQASGDIGYLRRNTQQFVYDHSPPPQEQSGMAMR